MDALIKQASAQMIFKELKGLNLDKDEVLYFKEFINMLYKYELISYDRIEHEDFIKNNKGYIESVKAARIKRNDRFIYRAYLNDMYYELRRLNEKIGFSYKHKVADLIKEYESLNGTSRTDKERVYVFIADTENNFKKMIGLQCSETKGDSNKKVVAVYKLKPGSQNGEFLDLTGDGFEIERLYFKALNVYKRPVAYLKVLSEGFNVFDKN
ncbi:MULTISPECIES: hypothetical protein [Pantoea]|jgi:hypothetical protein|nr:MULTISPECIES: hypothetical protein [Pantoea]MBZ6397590.1 hypothetical protein [Pantoea sp.]MBZ6440739.1 hypothetical protein [Pantoea sp.]NUY91849.1 hypothetical protein [Pantoea brenneri]NYB50502.1 hypothetical protein [Pantoea brenneri]NYB57365.1 hypothetical protein [Pantoea brenneri]